MSFPEFVGRAAFLVGAGVALLGFLLRALGLRRSRVERSGVVEGDLLKRLVSMPPPIQGPVRIALFAVGLGIVAAVWAGAGRGGDTGRGESGVEETVLTLDASNSMLARDVAPSRLDLQRTLATELVQRLGGSIGVVYFAGEGYVLSPLTPDRGAVLMQVDAVAPSRVGRGGSSLVDGLVQAIDLLAGGDPSAYSRAVVLFSDGEETADGALDAVLERAVRSEVTVHAVGVGTPEGGRIPLGSGDALLPLPMGTARPDTASDPSTAPDGPWLTGPEGDVVVTALQEERLRTIADATGGLYVPATPGGIARLGERLAGVSGPGEGRGSAASLLLFAAFGLLWAEAFLFRSG